MIRMKHRIWLLKLSLILKMNKQSTSTLSRMILEEQRLNNWPGLSKEVSSICETLKIPDINENDFDISMGNIKEAVMEHHDKELKEDYLNRKSLEDTRMAFRIRCEMVDKVKGNFKDKFKRQGGEEALVCQDCDCGEIQTQSHCLVCPKWEDIRAGLELDRIEDLVKFFQRLLKERDGEEKKDKTGSDGGAAHQDSQMVETY